MKKYDVDFSVAFLKLVDLAEKTKAGIRPVSESGDDGVYFGIYFDQNVGLFDVEKEQVCYYPIVDIDASERSEDGWIYYDYSRDGDVWCRVCHDYRDGKDEWCVVVKLLDSMFYVSNGMISYKLG